MEVKNKTLSEVIMKFKNVRRERIDDVESDVTRICDYGNFVFDNVIYYNFLPKLYEALNMTNCQKSDPIYQENMTESNVRSSYEMFV